MRESLLFSFIKLPLDSLAAYLECVSELKESKVESILFVTSKPEHNRRRGGGEEGDPELINLNKTRVLNLEALL